MKSVKISRRIQFNLFCRSGMISAYDLTKSYSHMFKILVALWQAVWLGLMDTSTLNELTWSFYASQSGFEAEEFNVHQGLWPWEVAAIRDHFSHTKQVLVAGAGGGWEVIALARLGYEVTGFDFSSFLVAACRNNVEKAGLDSRVLLSPPDRVPEGLDEYDALLIGRGLYHHIPSRERRITFLRLCLIHLVAGAPVILSDFLRGPLIHTFTDVLR